MPAILRLQVNFRSTLDDRVIQNLIRGKLPAIDLTCG
jgi:hypothetical protein